MKNIQNSLHFQSGRNKYSARGSRYSELRKKTWLTVKETALYLGKSEKAVREKLSSGKIPYYKFGETRDVYIAKEELDSMFIKVVH